MGGAISRREIISIANNRSHAIARGAFTGTEVNVLRTNEMLVVIGLLICKS
jgi:hypothetical protein